MHRHCKSINPSNCANSIELALDNWITSMDLHSQLSRLIALSSRKSNRCHLGMRLLIFHAGSNCRSEKGTGCFVKLRKSGIDSLRFPPSEGISISHTFTYSVQIPIYIHIYILQCEHSAVLHIFFDARNLTSKEVFGTGLVAIEFV